LHQVSSVSKIHDWKRVRQWSIKNEWYIKILSLFKISWTMWTRNQPIKWARVIFKEYKVFCFPQTHKSLEHLGTRSYRDQYKWMEAGVRWNVYALMVHLQLLAVSLYCHFLESGLLFNRNEQFILVLCLLLFHS